jgi:hypothetical protein
VPTATKPSAVARSPPGRRPWRPWFDDRSRPVALPSHHGDAVGAGAEDGDERQLVDGTDGRKSSTSTARSPRPFTKTRPQGRRGGTGDLCVDLGSIRSRIEKAEPPGFERRLGSTCAVEDRRRGHRWPHSTVGISYSAAGTGPGSMRKAASPGRSPSRASASVRWVRRRRAVDRGRPVAGRRRGRTPAHLGGRESMVTSAPAAVRFPVVTGAVQVRTVAPRAAGARPASASAGPSASRPRHGVERHGGGGAGEGASSSRSCTIDRRSGDSSSAPRPSAVGGHLATHRPGVAPRPPGPGPVMRRPAVGHRGEDEGGAGTTCRPAPAPVANGRTAETRPDVGASHAPRRCVEARTPRW